MAVNSQFGILVFTKGVNDLVADSAPFTKFVLSSLRRHRMGNWGNVSREDKAANDRAIIDGNRILSAYESEGLPKIWVITEANRSSTAVLFPYEY